MRYATEAGTATAGEDFTPVTGTLVFAAGETEGTVAVPILGDRLLEPDEETFTVVLSDPTETGIDDGLAVGTIRDDERCPGPNLLANPGAEERLVATDTGDELPGWLEVEGTEWTKRLSDPEPFEGEASFWAGTVERGELAQDADVAAYDVRIDDCSRPALRLQRPGAHLRRGAARHGADRGGVPGPEQHGRPRRLRFGRAGEPVRVDRGRRRAHRPGGHRLDPGAPDRRPVHRRLDRRLLRRPVAPLPAGAGADGGGCHGLRRGRRAGGRTLPGRALLPVRPRRRGALRDRRRDRRGGDRTTPPSPAPSTWRAAPPRPR